MVGNKSDNRDNQLSNNPIKQQIKQQTWTWKSFVSFVLTILAIVVILCGTCFLNVAIAEELRIKANVFLIFIWLFFPFILFRKIGTKINSVGMKSAAYVWLVLAIVITVIMLGL